jgi:hypothetical protein
LPFPKPGSEAQEEISSAGTMVIAINSRFYTALRFAPSIGGHKVLGIQARNVQRKIVLFNFGSDPLFESLAPAEQKKQREEPCTEVTRMEIDTDDKSDK